MSAPTIFYSWQSDLPASAGKAFLRSALEAAVNSIGVSPHLVESPRLDHDTKNVSGTPEIAGTIFRKIERSAVFVADVTLTQASTADCLQKKYSPNPNVMLELGYAAATVGWERIILVMNERFGGISKLPFDLRNRRWPTTFSVTPKMENTQRERDELANKLSRDVAEALASDYQRAADAIAQLAPHARRIMTQFANSDWIRDGSPAGGMIMGRDDFHCQQLLNLGIFRTEKDETGSEFHYTWTYLGRECCRRLGISIPLPRSNSHAQQESKVVTDLSAYDRLNTD